jgi:DNA-binding MarR family transcriptional regulator
MKDNSDLGWLDEDEQRLFRAFARSARWLFVQFDRDLQAQIAMPRAHFEILWLLHFAPSEGLRMSDLAEATGYQPSRITHAVTALESLGRVRRELCANDRRGWFAVITDSGRDTLAEAAPHYAETIRERLIRPLSRQQRSQLTQVGEVLLDELTRSNHAANAISK